MTGGEVSVLLSFLFLIGSGTLCVIYGIVAGSREQKISEKEKIQEEKWEKEEAKIDDELTGGVS